MNHLFKNKAFLIVTGSDLLQNLAIWVRNMAILYFIMEQTQSNPIAISLITVLEYVPIFVFSFIGGALADRWNPKRTMIVGDILSTLSIVLIIVVLATGYWQVLYLATFVSSIVSQFSQPSSIKIIKRNVEDEHVHSAIGLTQSSQSLFLILGPLVGTFIYTQLGIQASLYSLLVLFIASAVLLSFLPKDDTEKEVDTSLLSDLKEGWNYVIQSTSLRMVAIVFTLLGLSMGLVNPLEIFIITEQLGLDKTSLPYLSGASGLGLLVGGAIAAVINSKLNQNVTLIAGVCFLALATFGEVLSTWLWLTLIISFLGSVSLAFVNVVISTYMVTQIDEQLIGRVNGTITPLFIGAMLLGSSLSGVLMKSTSLMIVYAISALVLVVSVLPGLLVKFRHDHAATAAAPSQEL
ncbi:MFS transporter [Paenibacillus sp. 481]|uniref:MFS transporter n=1 Tax=Paenibacillus sp. 481 TaxID=2835869 RepID=UPI001E2D05B4|nr:MFS transporter [Paenibacillus sp. 481]UHA73330.1 MFS transporter [Paenibacillus sp. 481]